MFSNNQADKKSAAAACTCLVSIEFGISTDQNQVPHLLRRTVVEIAARWAKKCSDSHEWEKKSLIVSQVPQKTPIMFGLGQKIPLKLSEQNRTVKLGSNVQGDGEGTKTCIK